VVGVHEDLNLMELSDTIINEYVHYLQFTKKSIEKEYNKQLQEVGYWKNPYEKKASHAECSVFIMC